MVRKIGLAIAVSWRCSRPSPPGGFAGPGGPSITLYSGQHPQTVAALVSAFEKKTGIDVNVRSDDEDVLAAQIAQEGSHSPVTSSYREHAAARDLQQRGLLVRVSRVGRSRRRRPEYNSPQQGMARRLGPGQRHGLRHEDLKASQLPASVLALASPKWKGKLGLAPSEKRLPADRDRGRGEDRRCAHDRVAQRR